MLIDMIGVEKVQKAVIYGKNSTLPVAMGELWFLSYMPTEVWELEGKDI